MIRLALLLYKTPQRAVTTEPVEIDPWPDAEYMHKYNSNKHLIKRSYMPVHVNGLPEVVYDIIESPEKADENDEALRSSELRSPIWQTVTNGDFTAHKHLVTYLEHTGQTIDEDQYFVSRSDPENEARPSACESERTSKHNELYEQYTKFQELLRRDKFHLYFDTGSFFAICADVVATAVEAWFEFEDESLIDELRQRGPLLEHPWHFLYVQAFAIFATRTDSEAGDRPAQMWATFARKVNGILKKKGARIILEKAETLAGFKCQDY